MDVGSWRSPTPEKLGSAVPGPLSFPGVDTRPSRRSGPGGLRLVQSRHLRYTHEWVLPVWAIKCFGGLRREPLVGREVGLIPLEVEAIGAAHGQDKTTDAGGRKTEPEGIQASL